MRVLHEVSLPARRRAAVDIPPADDQAELSRQVADAIRLRKRDATHNGVYLNPLYVPELLRNVPGLEKAGFRSTITEGEVESGHKVAVKLRAPDGEVLDLGAVVLDGEDYRVEQALTPIQRVVNFVANHGHPSSKEEPGRDKSQNEKLSPQRDQQDQEREKDVTQRPEPHRQELRQEEPRHDSGNDSISRRHDPNAPLARPPFDGYRSRPGA